MMISDSHTDFLTYFKSFNERENYVKTLPKGSFIGCAVFTTNKNININTIKRFKYEIDYFNKVYNLNLMLTIEDLGFIKNEQELNELIRIKPFSVTLTWNYKNQFGGGALTNFGLTPFGREVIKKLENANILVDTAHLSRKAFFEFSKLTKFPIFNSHANINGLKKHRRNLTMKQLITINKSKGYVGLTIYEKFIKNNKISSIDIFKQCEFLMKFFPNLNFGLGTDLYGIDEEFLPFDIKKYSDFNKLEKYFSCKNIFNKIISLNFKNFCTNFMMQKY